MNFLNVLCKILLGFCLDNQFGILFYTLHDTSFWHHLFCWKSPCFFQHKPFHRYSRIFLFRISFHCQEIEFGIRQLLPDAFAVQNYLLEAKKANPQAKKIQPSFFTAFTIVHRQSKDNCSITSMGTMFYTM